MDRRERIKNELLVDPGTGANLAGRSCQWTADDDYSHLTHDELDQTAKDILAAGVDQLADAQELLWADGGRAVLLVFQAMDAAGKDSTIKHVMTGVNPQGVRVVSFKSPSSEELDHTFLWRTDNAAPARGEIGIFNRSHYEEVIALRVHPDWLDAQRLPTRDRSEQFWAERYEDVNAWERHLARNGTAVVKFFLHVSKAEQKRRFMKRLDRPEKLWKFNAADVVERRLWDDYMRAYDAAITATSTEHAPWYVIPADHKHVMQAMVASIIVDTINALDLAYPTVSAKDMKANETAQAELETEPDVDLAEPREQKRKQEKSRA